MSRSIILTRRQVAIVDAADYEWLSQWRWYAQWAICTKSFYAARGESRGKPQMFLMHRVILGLEKGDGFLVDHINRNTLDNRRCNLRIVTPSQNRMNSKVRSDSATGFKGVSRTKAGKFQAQRKVNGVNVYLGTRDTAQEAAILYTQSAEAK
jgi:hypothetical protein